MAGFEKLTSNAVPLDSANVDTDQIIPKQFLTAVTRAGFGKHLFHDWRYLDLHEQEPNPEFVLNKPQHQGAEILLARENFGCGSSREHAPWSLTDYGFKAIIATSFADIFYGNCMNNQLLPITLSSAQMDAIFSAVENDADTQIGVDLKQQIVTCGEAIFGFDIAEHHKHNMILGLDTVGQTMQSGDAIDQYETTISDWYQ